MTNDNKHLEYMRKCNPAYREYTEYQQRINARLTNIERRVNENLSEISKIEDFLSGENQYKIFLEMCQYAIKNGDLHLGDIPTNSEKEKIQEVQAQKSDGVENCDCKKESILDKQAVQLKYQSLLPNNIDVDDDLQLLSSKGSKKIGEIVVNDTEECVIINTEEAKKERCITYLINDINKMKYSIKFI